MPIRLIPSLLALIVVWGFTPGPANIYAMGCSILYGRRRTLMMWTGLLCGFSVAAIIAAIVTHIVGPAMSHGVAYLKYLGGIYILWLALTTFRNIQKESNGDNRSCTFATGFIVQLTNAKIILFDFMVYSVYVLPYSSRLIDLFFAAALLLIAGPGANLAWLLAGATMGHFLKNYRWQVSWVMAALLVVCAVIVFIG
ncbi:MAG: LysE family transporter [Prevotella sp.]|jgi:cysteine/O-acetylserine efflux protein|nr:LysE family transporter [Prevotella sp.]MCI2081414.1 LysE family transporter [Prevotella sp.]MCI2103129.1 LysE family transporter [Prevotella sp.]